MGKIISRDEFKKMTDEQRRNYLKAARLRAKRILHPEPNTNETKRKNDLRVPKKHLNMNELKRSLQNSKVTIKIKFKSGWF